MQLSNWQVLILITAGVLLAIVCVMVGAWLMFKSSRAVPGERFLGGVPKGEVFSIQDALDQEELPDDAEKTVLERTEQFLKKLGGQG